MTSALCPHDLSWSVRTCAYLVTSGGNLLFLFRRAVAMTLPSGHAHHVCNQSLLLRLIHLLSQGPSGRTGNVCVYGSEPGATDRQADRWNFTELDNICQDVSQQRIHRRLECSPVNASRNEAVQANVLRCEARACQPYRTLCRF